MAKLRILIGDDHTLMRQGLRKILEERPEWEIVAEAGDGRSAVRDTLELEPDVAVLDIGMSLLNGIEATAQITRKKPNVAVLILSMHADEAYVTQAVRAGARGYLLKDSAGADRLSELVRAFRSATGGRGNTIGTAGCTGVLAVFTISYTLNTVRPSSPSSTMKRVC